ncbi:polyvinyl alcohol dehydrogenase PvaA [Sphingopyxis sp. 113P3]|nr:polyvinyl alcohol dehydrogenase PvaA [Sphingopyxis sp. 113P3]
MVFDEGRWKHRPLPGNAQDGGGRAGQDLAGPRRPLSLAVEARPDGRDHCVGRRKGLVGLRASARSLLGLSPHHAGQFQLFQLDLQRRPCRVQRYARTYVAAGQYRRLQSLGFEHDGVASQGQLAQGFQTHRPAGRLFVQNRTIYGSLQMSKLTEAMSRIMGSHAWGGAVFSAATLIAFGSVVHASGTVAETAPQSGHAVPADQLDGETLYKARCAACHDNAEGRTPSREVLSKNPASFILASMRTGAMVPMAEGLTLEEMTAIARAVGKADAKTDDGIDLRRIWGNSVEGTPLDAPQCSSAPTPVDLGAANQWNGWSTEKDNGRFQRKPALDVADIPKLKLKWAFQYPGSKNGQATVIGDRLFTTSTSGAVYALNAKTGCVYWRHAAEGATRTSPVIAALPEGAPAKTALFFSDFTKAAVALDAETGKQLWKTVVDDQPALQMTGSITYWDGKIYVPISSGTEAFAQIPTWECCKFRGALVALDAATGKILWKRYTTEQEPRPFKLNKAGRQMWGPSGGAIWVTPTVDEARRLIYVGTSNSYTDVPYDNSDSVMAIDADTGAVRWTVQLLADDNYIDGCWQKGKEHANCPNPLGPDFSIGAAPIYRKMADGKEFLLVGQKSGMIYALDPANKGAKIWERQLSLGSALGGIEFGTAADDGKVYAGVSDIASQAKDRGKPGLWALDIRTGEVAWNFLNAPDTKCRWNNWWCHGAFSQAISVIPGAIFAGSYDGHFRAFDTATGKIIWDVDTGTKAVTTLSGAKAFGGVMDGAGPTIAGGMVYVHSGYAGRSSESGGRDLRGTDGNILMAFSVDGK